MTDLRVLLVDDSPDDAAFAEHCLRRAVDRQYILSIEESGTEGLARIRREPPDCLLLDHGLPDMSGLEILSELGADGAPPPFAVVMLTGSGDDGIAVAALRAGADDYLIKGEITPDGLRRAVENAVEKCRLRKERHAAEVALRTSEERLKLVVEASHDGIWDCDLATRSVFVSDRIYDLLGLDPAGRAFDASAAVDLLHPDDRQHVLDALRVHLETGTHDRIELRLRRTDGTYGWYLVTGKTQRDAGGRAVRMAGSLSDITERKRIEQALRESDERFRMALENAPITAFTQDLDLRYTWAHKAVGGLVPAEIVGRTDRELVPAQYADPLEAIKRRVIETGQPAREIVAFPIPGGEGHFDLSVEPWRDAQGEILGVICVTVDVTAQQDLDRARQTFLATVSHELRNPLAALNGYAQLLQRRGTYNERAVSAMVNQAARMRTLVDDMLDVTRLSVGQLELNQAECDVAALARAAVERARVAGTPHRLLFEAPETPLTGWWDATRIAQVLDNLLSNAIKYSPDGGEISVRVTGNATEARVEVADQGIGIPADVLPRLFDRFYRVGEARVEGLGLGLHITRELIQAHGGRIEVQSEPGRGSTFIVVLPIDGVGAGPATRAASPRNAGQRPSPDGAVPGSRA